MPVLQACDDKGQLIYEAPVLVFTAMLFPDQPDRRNDLLIGAVVDICIKHNIPIVAGAARAIRDMPSSVELKEDADRRFAVGIAVGFIFNNILALARSPTVGARASVSTVVTLAAQKFENKGVASKTTLESWWRTMAPVRHLWGAWVARGAAIHNFEYIEDENGPASHSAEANFACFLREAMQALEYGSQHRSKASSRGGPLADPEASFVMPDHWRMPAPYGPWGTFRVGDPSPEYLAEIEGWQRSRVLSPTKPGIRTVLTAV